MATSLKEVPLLSLRQGKRQFAAAFTEGLQAIGFVRITDHDLPKPLLEKLYRAAAGLFAHPPQTLARFHHPKLNGQRGFVPFRTEQAESMKVPDEKEFWHIGREELLHNIWPTPEMAPDFARLGQEVYRRMDILYLSLLRSLELALEIEQGTLVDLATGANNSVLRIAHYPALKRDRPVQAVRAAAHGDINMLTLLVAATEPGLQVETRSGEWIDAGEQEGEIIVNAGLMLKRATNQWFPATKHRVVNPDGGRIQDKARISAPFFGHPRLEAILYPDDAFLGEGMPQPQPPITAQAYLQEILAKIGLSY